MTDAAIARPLVSVIIPTFNHARYLAQAIGSVLAQSYAHHEIVVVDDASTDDTPRVLERFPMVRVVKLDANIGLSRARNAGIEASRGEYLVFLDADDWLRHSALEIGVAQLQQRANLAFASGAYALIDPAGNVTNYPERDCPADDHYLALLAGNYVGALSAAIFRRDEVVAAGGFDSTLDACEDYDLLLRIARVSSVGCHRAVVTDYRQHGDNMSSNAARMLRAAITVLRKQRPFLGDDPRRRAAYNAGIALYQRYYGLLLVEELRADEAAHRWSRVIPKFWTLARYHQHLARHHAKTALRESAARWLPRKR